MIEFRLPSLGADMDEGTLLEWHVKPGDEVKRGQVVALVDTTKAAVDVECWDEGTVDELLVEPHTRVPVGAVLALLRAPGETAAQAAQWKAERRAVAPPAAGALAPPIAPSEPEALARGPIAPEAAGPTSQRRRVSPLARRRAAELGIALESVAATGADGSVTLVDVERAAEQARSPALAARPEELARGRVSPAARKHAEEKGIELDRLPGTGPDGAVTVEDVERAAAARPGKAPRDEATRAGERAAEMRRTIAAAMARSKREIPHYYLATDIPLTAASVWLNAQNEQRPVTERLLMAVLLIKAVAVTLARFPELNGFWRGECFEPSAAVHVGVAISLRQGGLAAPALLDVPAKPLDQLMRELSDLVKRTRAYSLKSSELAMPTVTVTNLGDQGVEAVFGVIYPPQVALIGFGKVTERAWVADGGLHIGPVVTASLAADHRASDGHRGGLFLAELKALLQQPERL